MIDGTNRTGSARRGAGPEGTDECVGIVLRVLKVPPRALVDVSWLLEDVVVGWKLKTVDP